MVVGCWPVSNSASLKVLDIDYGIDDVAVVQLNSNKPKKLKIYYGNARAFIKFKGTRFYFDECLKG